MRLPPAYAVWRLRRYINDSRRMLWTLDRLSRHVFIPGRMLSALKCTIWGYKKPDKFPRDVQGADLRMEVAEQLYLISIPVSPALLSDKPPARSLYDLPVHKTTLPEVPARKRSSLPADHL